MTDSRFIRGADENDAYSHAADDEPLFTMIGRDRHAAALVELWAYMREKEGEPAESVAAARAAADEMRSYGAGLGRPMLTLDTLVTLAAGLVHDREAERRARAEAAALGPLPGEGDLVTARGPAFSGHVGQVVRVFPDDAEPAALRGQMNVLFGRGSAERTITVSRAAYRPATDAERGRA